MLHVESVHTHHQVLQLEGQLQTSSAVLDFDLDRAAQRLRVCWDPVLLDVTGLLALCAQAGCKARPLSRQALDDSRRRESHAALKRLLVAGLFAMQAMMFALVLYLAQFGLVDGVTRELFRWLCLLAALPVLLWAAQPFYRQAMKDLRSWQAGTDTVVTVGVLLVCVGSVVALVRGDGHVYFESISMLVFVLLLGRWLEMKARHRNGALTEAAADAEPLAAQRREPDGHLQWVAVDELQPGDSVHVAEGRVVPVDGRMASGCQGMVDESLLSGESSACRRSPGDRLVAGSVVVSGPIDMQVERSAAHSTLTVLSDLAQRAGARVRSNRGDQLAARFAARVLLLTCLTAAFWLWWNPARVLESTIAVLVVACPCAFALAEPVVLSRLMAVLARHGIWVTRPAALSALAQVDHVVFDKTGTLTSPQLQLDAIDCPQGGDASTMLRQAASLARESSHPLSRMVAAAVSAEEIPRAEKVCVVEGAGIEGQLAGRTLRLGRPGFAKPGMGEKNWPDEALLLAEDRAVLAVLPVRERLRAESRYTVAALQDLGVQVRIASGDAPSRVADAAAQLGVDHWQARLGPQQKLAIVDSVHQQGGTLLAVGDGSNDAPLLAAADVSAALVDGTDMARAHADLLLTKGLDGLVPARQMVQRAQRILQQNHRGALIYNLCAVPFAAAGLVSPWLAVIGMSISSLGVVLNAWRIREPTGDVVGCVELKTPVASP